MDEEMPDVYFDMMQDTHGDLHVYPEGDLIPHQLSMKCPCQPVWDEKNKLEYGRGDAKQRVIIHKFLKDPENQH